MTIVIIYDHNVSQVVAALSKPFLEYLLNSYRGYFISTKRLHLLFSVLAHSVWKNNLANTPSAQ